MNFKHTVLHALLGLFLVSYNLSAQVQLPSFKDSKQIKSLNGTWQFKYIPSSDLGSDASFYNTVFDVSQWSTIKVPGNWELQGFAEPVYGKKLKNGTGLYSTNFTVPADWNKNPVYISFDGVQSGYSLWINGNFAGEFASAFNRQTFDISKFVKPGQPNILAVKVITQPKGWEFDTNDDWSLAGIFRDVTLFSLPQTHLNDVTIKTFVNTNSATVAVEAIVGKTIKRFSKNLTLSAELIDAKGKLVKTVSIMADAQQLQNDLLSFNQKITVDTPQLWSAENPYLYTLRLTLKDKNTEIQQRTEKVGIREISWTDGVLKLNGIPIKLKGVNHHDLSPKNGRAITESELKEDLDLMRKANVNFIRLCHYPPQPRLLELCDSLGFYLMDEVPFGYGDELLTDFSYLPILKQRAKSTIWRDKNHPSVIVWSVGNENPVTEIGLLTGRYVKKLDNTRPYCFPQTPTVIKNMMKAMPDSLDVLDFHYPKVSELKEFAKTVDRPLIAGEYAHALGLDFGTFEASYEVMYQNPKLAGGAIWGFLDQGILRKTDKKVSNDKSTIYTWPNKDTIYDTGDIQGTDGVLYANRVPQVDYWQLRKVYSPVIVFDDSLYYQGGKSELRVRLQNRFDFTNLSNIKCKWELIGDTTVLSSGELPLKGNPREIVTEIINVTLPEKPTLSVYYLKILFEDQQQYQFYEKSFRLQTKEPHSILNSIAVEKASKTVKRDNVLQSDRYHFELRKDFGGIQLKNKNGVTLISEGVFARVGRKESIAQGATLTSKRSKERHTISTQFLLSKPETEVKSFNSKELIVNYKFSLDSLKQEPLAGEVAYDFSNNGQIKVDYRFVAESKKEAVETGLSFIIPASFTQFRWAGKGPYASYPGKEKLSEFGIYQLNTNDLYLAGNRQNVECAVFTNENGDGFALIADNANIAVERTANGIVVSHNAHVSGVFNKYEWPENLFSFANGKEIKGNFTIVPFTAESYPKVLKELFGESQKTVKAFQPFYNSYDQ
ncbi:glycoside hydrolase family 2 TIM barrel-domain containing protein [Flavobacterium ajazii]|uniref:glycoside hydrolase family 2 TIM barrel-domain containing protein n=1 Tax=Flavobacterium ajazii TaxID=2692318 RepID=UPI0013D3EE23|nr:glycoside hydrolase family 2 TIM barrel-domain containing protein [Flavobacterium ajazii]